MFGEENVPLNLTQLLQLIEEMPAYRRLLKEQPQSGGETMVVVLDAAKPYLIAALYRRWHLPMLVVTAQPESVKKLYEQLLIWTDSPLKLFPEPDALPYERITSDATAELERVQVLSALANCDQGESSMGAPLVVASAPALMTKTAPYSDFVATCHTLELGMEITTLLSRPRVLACP